MTFMFAMQVMLGAVKGTCFIISGRKGGTEATPVFNRGQILAIFKLCSMARKGLTRTDSRGSRQKVPD